MGLFSAAPGRSHDALCFTKPATPPQRRCRGHALSFFSIHVTPDNDRCVAFDRQRVEIKTYSPSPDYLKAYEQITYGSNGTYSLTLTNIADGTVLLSHSSTNIDLWRTGTTFVRPKWGIYRSLNSSSFLRNEAVRFYHFCLAKGSDDCPPLF